MFNLRVYDQEYFILHNTYIYDESSRLLKISIQIISLVNANAMCQDRSNAQEIDNALLWVLLVRVGGR